MNLSSISSGSIVGRLLRIPLNMIPAGATLPILQGRTRGWKWIVGSSNHGCWLGSYEYDKTRAFEKYVVRGGVVYDIGSHAGFYTLLASELVGRRGHVYAFEPLPRNIAYLEEHLRMNSVRNTTVYAAAVSDQPGRKMFSQGDSSSMGCLHSAGALEVDAVSLDDLYKRGELLPPTAIKIDIEGGEYRALLGAKQVLGEAKPAIFLATHSSLAKRECVQLLCGLGYKTSEPWDDPHELIAIPEPG